jgi:uncharacterized small protein (DUF1192 family)|tara:strand:+ start:401 stop:577 length:177 start_codon:yes stop_codon:yes gene_type:complete
LPDKEYKEGLASFKSWLNENKRLERMGLYGTDHYIKEVEKLQAKVKRLEAKLKKKGNK